MKRHMIAIVCLATMTPMFARADGLRTEIGVDYTTGTYGGELSTNILAVPLSVGYVHKSWAVKATLPWLQVSGPGNVIPGLTPIVQDRRNGASKPEDFGDDAVQSGTVTSTTNSGIGDLVLSGAYSVIDNPEGWRVGLTGRVKIPTADANKNLGTGETDYAALVEVERIVGRFSPFVTVGYRWLGDTATLNYRNQPFGIVGVGYIVNDLVGLDASFYWSAPAVEGLSAAADASIAISFSLTQNLRLSGYVLHGFTDGSPDWGGGIRTRWSFQ
jgi:hypothetical protein